MKVLFIHQNFPGQFLHLSADLARDPANQVVALTISQSPVAAGVVLRPYTMLRPAAPETHPLLQDHEAKLLRAEACAAAAFQLKREGFVPDVIIAHPGWGEALFMKDVFPAAKLLVYCEYYYALEGQDVGFDPEMAPLNFEQRCRLRLKNTSNLLSMEAADGAIAPTAWQKATYPKWAQEKITVIHDGIDLARLAANPRASLTLAATPTRKGQHFVPGDEVVSYVARTLEPIRGFQVFMRSLPQLLERRPQAHAVIVGGDDGGYGHRPPAGGNWRDALMAEVGGAIDPARVHFVGQVGAQSYLDLLQVSRVHGYWTAPFVLSWSFLEAALSGLPVVASATAPVLEFASRLGVETHPFHDAGAFADAFEAHLAMPRASPRPLRVLDELSKDHCVAAQKRWLAGFVATRR